MVPTNEIIHRIVASYWPQSRVFNFRGQLSQNRTGRSIPDRIADVRTQLAALGLRTGSKSTSYRP